MLTGKVWNRTAIRVLEFPFTGSVFYGNMFPSILEKLHPASFLISLNFVI